MQDEQILPRRFVGIRRKISLFMVTAVLAVIGIALLVAYKQGVFVRHTSIFFYAADVFGINKGMSVRLFGLPVGNVKDLQISDRGVKVELSIISDYTSRIPKNSNARLMREGYIGAGNIQIIPGVDPEGARVHVSQGDEIGFVPNRGIAEIVDDFKSQLSPVVTELRHLIAEMNRPDGHFRKSFESASVVLEQLPETNRELRQALRSADAALASTARVGAQTERELPRLAAKLATTLDSLSEAANEIRTTTKANGEALHEVLNQAPAIMRNGSELVRDSQEVVGAAKNTWLIRDYIDAPAMRTLPVDSFESFGAGPGKPLPGPAPR
jgi:phospholipid/cholesterol/gamma-HCH transport system substrate-binding protein